MSALTDLPNIGPELSRRLLAVGMETPEQLLRAGSVATFARMAERSPGCYGTLYALEGVIQNCRWHKLTQERRSELREAAARL